MPNPRLASRYAKSLIDLAMETGQLEAVFHDMKLLNVTCNESRELVNFIRSPIINADKKKKIFFAIFQGQLSDLTSRFCNLLISKGREEYLPEIAQSAIRQYRKIRNIQQVKITTAVPMDEELKTGIIEKVKSEIPEQKIELLTQVNEDLIGGFVLETENTVFDASILRDLKDVKSQFLKNVYIRNIR